MLQSDINDNRMKKDLVGCPMRTDGCEHKFSRQDVHKWLEVVRMEPVLQTPFRDLIEKYDRFVESNAAARNPDVRWCIKPDCGEAMVREGGKRLMTCKKCGTEHCFDCRQLYHPRWFWQSCEGHD